MKKIAFVLSAAGLMSACNQQPPIDNAVAVDCSAPQPNGVALGKTDENSEDTAALCPDGNFYNSHDGNVR